MTTGLVICHFFRLPALRPCAVLDALPLGERQRGGFWAERPGLSVTDRHGLTNTQPLTENRGETMFGTSV